MIVSAISRLIGSILGSSLDPPAQEPADAVDVDRSEVAKLANAAAGQKVTPELLANDDDYVYRPPITYLEEGEKPEFALMGVQLWIGDANLTKPDEIPFTRIIVLITDERIVLIVGKNVCDTVWQIPFESVKYVTIKYSEAESYFVVDAVHEGVEQSFLVELYPFNTGERYRRIARYCTERAA